MSKIFIFTLRYLQNKIQELKFYVNRGKNFSESKFYKEFRRYTFQTLSLSLFISFES
jgi:hypothetical protein